MGASFEDDGGLSRTGAGGLSRTGAIDIEHPAADTHGASDLRKTLRVTHALVLLVRKPADDGHCKDATLMIEARSCRAANATAK